jgi:hypothetical protein
MIGVADVFTEQEKDRASDCKITAKDVHAIARRAQVRNRGSHSGFLSPLYLYREVLVAITFILTP